MAVYREGFYALIEIQKASKRLYSDSCDFGAPCKKGDRIWNLAKQLSNSYGKKETRKVNSYSTGQYVTIEVTLIDEWAVTDERKTLKEATEKYSLSFVTLPKSREYQNYDGFVSISKIDSKF